MQLRVQAVIISTFKVKTKRDNCSKKMKGGTNNTVRPWHLGVHTCTRNNVTCYREAKQGQILKVFRGFDPRVELASLGEKCRLPGGERSQWGAHRI